MDITDYRSCVPQANIFRRTYADHWFRFHSLVESKRYPEDQQDWDELHFRHACVLADVFRRTDCVDIVTLNDQKIGTLIGDRLMQLDEDYNGVWLYCFSAPWPIEGFKSILEDVASDKLASVLIQSRNNGNIYAPYDGGADIFMKDNSLVRPLREKFATFLSAREDGL